MSMEFALENFESKTKEEDTKKKYLARTMQLMNRAKKELNLMEHDTLDVRQLVVWLNEHKKNINPNTWRQYKNSVVYYLEILDGDNDELQASVEALEYLKEKTSFGSNRYTEKTSSLKLKKISYEDWQKLDHFLTVNTNKWHTELRFWLRASIITGLRPVEWKNAQFTSYDGKPALKIQNAKRTNGRSHGESRTLILEQVTEEDIINIKAHLNNVRTFKGIEEYDYFYKGCSIALYKACRKCWPRRKKHITLYSTRHQFSANAKSSGFSKLEVAAMMGHAVDITATIHYGRKQAGNETLGVCPIDADVEKVRAIQIDDFKSIIDKKQDNLL
jgi:hypothetical protein